ncbi:CARDB domain-containing protein [Microbulbifer sp. PAAF003]|uniref:CARDB domain-containing protein n=1 Tax=Microbulbifer sp. PAAF003 TaxID=3243375 RepID=UPI00403A6792
MFGFANWISRGNQVLGAALATISLCWSAQGVAGASGGGDPFDIPQGAYLAEFVEDSNGISVMRFSGNLDKKLPDGTLNQSARAVIAQEFYEHHPDIYDFLVVFSAFEYETEDALAFHIGVRNDVQGIGMSQFDLSHLYGSDGRLRGYIDMAAASRYELNPLEPAYEDVLSTLAHETLHNWGIKINVQKDGAEVSDVLLGKDDAHWNFFLDSGASVEYGHRWRDNGDGSFTATAARRFYSPLDLYLMGINTAEEVPDFYVIQPQDGTEYTRYDISRQGVSVTGTREYFSIQDVIAAEGERVPAVADAQKKFNFAFIYLVDAQEEARDIDVTRIGEVGKAYSERFAILTGGRGIANIFPEGKDADIGAAEEVGADIETGRQDGGNVQAGIEWLNAQQTAEGYWADKSSTRLRDTTAVIEVLENLGRAYDRQLAMEWLQAQPLVDTDSWARALLVADTGSFTSGLLKQLKAVQLSDGGWPLKAGLSSDPLDTALSVRALLRHGDMDGVLQAINYLKTTQLPAGGWPAVVGGAADTATTISVAEALLAANPADTAAQQAGEWLVAQQNADGGFGSGESAIHLTAEVIRIASLLELQASFDLSLAQQYLADRQTEAGSWGGSVYASAMAARSFRQLEMTNLLVEQVQVLPASPRDGELAELLAVVRNDSVLEADPVTAQFYNGDPENGGVALGDPIPLSSTSPKSSWEVHGYWDTTDASGVSGGLHQIYLVVDNDAAVAERNEADNAGGVSVVVQAPVDGVELELDARALAVTPATTQLLPNSVAVSAVLRNVGAQAATSVTVELWRGEVGTGELQDSQQLTLGGRTSAAVNLVGTISAPGTQAYTLVVDPTNEFAEQEEGNNQAVVSVTSEPALDLAVFAEDISVAPASPFINTDAEFSVDIRNRGTQDSPSVNVRYLVNTGSGAQEIYTSTIAIEAGQTASQTIPWRVDAIGALNLVVEIDPANDVPELDEGNNSVTFSFNTGIQQGTNLVTSYKDIQFSTSPAFEGEGVSISSSVSNTGNEDATSVEVAFYDGDPDSAGVLLGTEILPSVASGESVPVEFVWAEIPTSADRVIYIQVDPDNKIDELGIGDNLAFLKLPVKSLPDLLVSSSDIVLDPVFPKLNDTVDVNISVVNQGNLAAETVEVELYKEGALVGTTTLSQIAGNGASVATIPVTFDAQGRQDLRVVVDPDNAIRESSTANNEATRQISIQDGNFYVSEKYISPDGNGIQDSTEFYFNLQTSENVYVELQDKYERVARSWTEPFSEAVSAGNVSWDGRRDSGAVAADGVYRFMVRSSQGDILGETSVVLDTNRSSLTEAIDTPYGLERDLSCRIGTTQQPNFSRFSNGGGEPSISAFRDGLAYSNDDQFVYFSTYLEPYSVDGQTYDTDEYVKYPSGIYRALSDGTQVLEIISFEEIDSRDIVNLMPSPDGKKLLVSTLTYVDGDYLSRLYLSNIDGSDLNLINEFSGERYGPHIGDAVFANGSDEIVYVKANGYSYNRSGYEIHRIDLKDPLFTSQLIGAIPADEESNALSLEANKSADRILARKRGNYEEADSWDVEDFYPQSRPETYLVDLSSNSITGLGDASLASWSPDGNRLAVVQHISRGVQLLDKNGLLIQEYSLPEQVRNDYLNTLSAMYQHKYWGIFRAVEWSPEGNEFAVVIEDHARFLLAMDVARDIYSEEAKYTYYTLSGPDYTDIGGLYVVDIKTGNVEKKAKAAPLPFLLCTGWECEPQSFHVSVWDGENWQHIAEKHLGANMRTAVVPVNQDNIGEDLQVRIKIQQIGHEEAQIEKVALVVDGVNRAPDTVISEQTGHDLTELVAAADNRWADVWNQTVEFTWNLASDSKLDSLVFTARESSPSKLPLVHFSYPNKKDYYEFLLGSGANISVDGMMDSQDNLGEPAFTNLTRPHTGHPSEVVYGYIGSDHQSLKVAVDFTVDNTDGIDDWASVEVLTDNGWKSFVINGLDSTWGAVSFIQTENAPWEHHYYEFDIPLKEIGKDSGEVIQYRIHAFGSAAEVDQDQYLDWLNLQRAENGFFFDEEMPVFMWNLVDLDEWTSNVLHSTLEWLPGAREVLLGGYHPYSDSGLNLINFDQPLESRYVFSDHQFLGAKHAPSVSDTGRLLSMYSWKSDGCIGDSELTQWDEGLGFKQFKSLLNGAADLIAIRTSEEGGVVLRGSAVDKNFANYTLEYSTEESPDNWQQLAPASGIPVIDGKFTTWVAPEIGRYNIRLTVNDLAGNSRREIKSVTVAESASIRNVFRQPAYFSPNGDGKQDTVELNFTVAEPVNLLVEVLDANRNTVRRFEQSYTDIGAEEVIYWDGRNDAGQAVAEGEYFFRVQKFEYRFVLDNTLPVIDSLVADLLVPQPVWVEGEPTCVPNYGESQDLLCKVALDRNIAASLYDNFGIESQRLEYRANGDTHWIELPVEISYQEPSILLPRIEDQERTTGELKGGDYRFVVADYAGNTSTLPIPQSLKKNKLYITGAELEPVEYQAAVSGDLMRLKPLGSAILDTGLDRRLEPSLPDIAPALIKLVSTLQSPVASIDVLLDETDDQGILVGNPTIVTPVEAFLVSATDCNAESGDCMAYAAPDTAYASSKAEFHIVWDPTDIDLGDGRNFRLSVRIKDMGGNEFVSNQIGIAGQVATYGITEIEVIGDGWSSTDIDVSAGVSRPARRLPAVDFYNQVEPSLEEIQRLPAYTGWHDHLWIAAIPAEYEKYAVLVSTQSRDEIGKIELFASAENAPEIFVSSAQITGHTALPFTFPDGHEGYAYALDASVLQECQSYNLTARVYNPDDPQTSVDESDEIRATLTEVLDVPCVEVYATVEPQLAEDCDMPLANILQFKVTADSISEWPGPLVSALLEEVEFVSLSIARRDEITGEWTDVLYNVNEPALGESYEFALDTSDFISGEEEFRIEYVDTRGKHYQTELTAYIDKTAPVIEIDSPLAGEQVCAVQVPLYDEEANIVPVSGRISSETPLTYYGVAASDLVRADGASKLINGNIPTAIHAEIDGIAQQVFTCGESFSGTPTTAIGEERCSVEPPWPSAYNANVPIRFGDAGTYSAFGSLGVLPTKHTGTLEFQYSAYDWSGIRACRSVEIEVDADVVGFSSKVTGGANTSGSYFYADQALPAVPAFAPLLGSEFSEIYTEFSVGEAVEADLEVYSLVSASEQSPQILLLGDLVATPVQNRSALAGETALVFDGRGLSGEPLADGLYLLRLRVTDACGNSRKAEYAIEIDNTAPLVSLSYPTAGDLIGLVVDVLGTAVDKNMAVYTVEYRDPMENGYLQIASSSRSVNAGVLAANWNTFGLIGDIEFRIVATDIVGHVSEVLYVFNIPERTDLISEFEVIEPFFSPNEDGVKDFSGVRVHFEQPVVATLAVGGTTVVDAVAFDKGIRTIKWDGRIDSAVQPDGQYELVLSVESQATAGLQQEERGSVVLDNLQPSMALEGLKENIAWVGIGGSLIGSINDSNLESYAISIAEDPAVAGEIVASGEFPVASSVLIDSGSNVLSEEGDYWLKTVVTDKAGNHILDTTRLVIDQTAPATRIDSIIEGSYLSGDQEVVGSVQDHYLESYTLTLVDEQSSDTELLQGSADIDGTLLEWRTGQVLDGKYRLVLLAVDFAGNESTTELSIEIDNTAPLAEFSLPEELGYYSSESGFVGSVADTNLKQFEVSIAPGRVENVEDSAFRIQSLGTASISGASLGHWAELPADGIYTVKLDSLDKAGNQTRTVRPYVLDTTAPQVPLLEEVSIAKDESRSDITWASVDDEDLAGYLVYRNGQEITSQLLTETVYADTGLLEGEYRYHVVAVDNAGNESEPSNTIDVVLDLTPPDVRIISPATESVVSGLVDIIGTAHSESDFKTYRLYVEDIQGNSTLLIESSLALQGQELAQWDTLAANDPSGYRLRLEAEDLNENVGSVEILVYPDNLPPPAPENLVASVSGNQVDLTWNPVTGIDDLAGYVLFKDDQLVGVSEVVLDGLLPYAQEGTSASQSDLVDGNYNYLVYAIDLAGNVSDASNLATASIELGAPQAVITTPEANAKIEFAAEVSAEVNANDVAQVSFEYRASGETTWQQLAVDAREPFTQSWDTSALPYGNYELRAVATDTNNNTDTNPAVQSVIKADLVAPAQVADLDLSVDGGQVSLSWSEVTDEDLAGYLVYRHRGSSQTQLTPTPIEGLQYLDQDVADSEYLYTIVAVDMAGNQADPSPEVQATVFTPVVSYPWTPTAEAEITVNVETLPNHDLIAEKFDGADWVALAVAATGDTGYVDFTGLVLDAGDNRLRFVAVASSGNRSKLVERAIFRAPSPSAVQDVAATENVLESLVDISWQQNPAEEEIFGYRVYKDGEAISQVYEPAVDNVTAEPNSYYSSYSPLKAINDNSSYWRPTNLPVTLELEFSGRHLLTQLDIRWYSSSSYYQASQYDIYGWDGNDWALLRQFTDTRSSSTDSVALQHPYLTDKIQIRFKEPVGYSRYGKIRLDDINFYALPTVAGVEEVDDDVSNGYFSYQVSAVNTWGISGPLSEAAEVAVGDVVAPEAVVLAGVDNESTAELSWSASLSTDVQSYMIERDGVLIGTVTSDILAFSDPGLSNGTYRYRVFAKDTAGNESSASNEVDLVINVAPIGAPVALQAQNDETTGYIGLTWLPAPETAPIEYKLYRSLTAGRDYAELASVSGLSYVDRDVANEVTYYYVVRAVDSFENLGLQSAEVEVTSRDTQISDTAIQMPSTALDHNLVSRNIGVTGLAEVGAEVFLMKDGEVISTVNASALDGSTDLPFADIDEVIRGFDGGVLVWGQVWGQSGSSFYDGLLVFSDGEWVQMDMDALYEVAIDPYVRKAVLAGDSLYIAEYDSPAIYQWDIQTGQITEITNGVLDDAVDIEGFVPSENAVVARGWFGNYGLLSLEDFSWVNLPLLSPRSFSISADGERIAYTAKEEDGSDEVWRLYSYELRTEENTYIADIPDSDSASVLSGSGQSQDGRKVLVSSRNLTSGRDETYLVDTVDKSVVQLLPEYLYATPQSVSLDGSKAVIEVPSLITSGQEIYVLYDIETAEVTQLESDCFWTSIGGLCNKSPVGSHLIPESGIFNFSSVPLQFGENLFTAFAMDPVGNLSLDSDPLVINRLGQKSADLSVTIEPSPVILPIGADTSLAIEIGNIGSAGSLGTRVDVSAVYEDGRVEAVGNVAVAPLPAGASISSSLYWQPEEAGRYQLVAKIDPDFAIDEISESNNTSLATVDVLMEAAPLLELEFYGSGSTPYRFSADTPVSGRVTLTNGGAVLEGDLSVSVVDASGNTVSTLYFEQLGGLAYGSRVEQEFTWNTGTTWAGDYKLLASLVSEAGIAVSREIAFEILPDTEIVAGISSGASSYRPDESVRLNSVLQNIGTNQAFGGGMLQISVTDPSGAQVFARDREVGEIMPAGQSVSSVDWAVDGASAGTYTATLALVEASQVVSQAQTQFAVRAAAPVLEGALELHATTVPQRDAIEVGYTVSNASNSGASGASIQVELTSVADGSVVDMAAAVFNVDKGSVINSLASLSGDQTIGNYQVVLKATFVYEGITYSSELARAAVSVVDGEPPEISLVYPQDGAVVKGVANYVRLHAADSVSSVELVEASLNDGDWKEVEKSETLASEYLAPMGGLPDGDYGLQAKAADELGNLSDALSSTFTVDNTSPTIVVNGVEDGVVYSTAVSPEVQVTDLHLVETSVMLNGTSFSSGSTLEEDGEYQLEITARDMADNFVSRIVLFQMDTTPAQIFVEGITDGASYNTAVTPIVTVTDEGGATLDLSLNGQPFVSGSEVAAEGSYLLEATAVDVAGNLSQVSWQFTLDLTPPAAPLVVEPLSGATVDTNVATLHGNAEAESLVSLNDGSQVRVTHADTQGVFEFAGVSLATGANAFSLWAEDHAGNRSETTDYTLTYAPTADLSLSAQLVTGKRVLVWLPERDIHKHPSCVGGGHGGHDPHYAHYGHDIEALNTLVAVALDEAGFEYVVVRSAPEFLTKLRSQQFGSILVGAPHVELGLGLALSGEIYLEVRGAVAAGTGLTVVSTHPGFVRRWNKLFGGYLKGSLEEVDAVELDGDFGSLSGNWSPSYTKGLQYVPLRGMGRGRLRYGCGSGGGCKSVPGVIFNQYAEGKVALVPFNPAALPEDVVKAFIGEAVEYTMPAEASLVPGGIVESKWTVSEVSSSMHVALEVDLLGDGLWTDLGDDGEISDETARWLRYLEGSSETQFSGFVGLTNEAGKYQLNGRAIAGSDFSLPPSDTAGIEFEVQQSSVELGNELIHYLESFEAYGIKRLYRNIAIAKVKVALSIDLQEKSDAGRAVHWLLGAIAIADVLNSEELDRRLGELLKVYQAAWTRLPYVAGPVPPGHPWKWHRDGDSGHTLGFWE